jgi:Spy/CpxP family protein refolding chaperone
MKSQAKGKSRFRRLAAAAGIVVLASAVACAATVDEDDQADEITARELAAQRGEHFRGPVMVVIDAAWAHGNLTAEQQEVLLEISEELEDARESHREMGEKLRSSGVEIVRSGTADSEQFDQSLDQAVEAIEQHMVRAAATVEEIHATLEPDQRAAVADALRDRIAAQWGRHHHDEARHREGFRRLAAHLMLSALQIDKLKAMRKELLGERKRLRPSKKELLALVDAFEGEDVRPAINAFHADKLGILRDRLAEASERADTMLSILTPGQRDLLADLIEDGPRKVLFGDEEQQASD